MYCYMKSQTKVYSPPVTEITFGLYTHNLTCISYRVTVVIHVPHCLVAKALRAITTYIITDLMSLSRFHGRSHLNRDMHGLILDVSI